MTVPSLKELTTVAVVSALQAPLQKVSKKQRDQVANLPDDLIEDIVKYIFQDVENRIEALQYITCRSITEVGSSIFCSKNAKRVLELVLQAFPELTTLNCSLSNVDSSILQEVFSVQNTQEEQAFTMPALDCSTGAKNPSSLGCVQSVACLEKLTKVNLFQTKITSLSCIPKSIKELNLTACNELLASEFGQNKDVANPLVWLIDYIACNVFNTKRPIVTIELFKNLTKLYLSHTKITCLSSIPVTVEELDIGWCRDIPVIEFTHLARLTNLIKLIVSHTKITRLDAISDSVEELDMSICREILASEFAYLARLTKVKKLNVSFTKITRLDEIPDSVEELDMSICDEILATEFAHLARLTNLIKLKVSNTKITCLNSIPESVEELDIRSCKGIPASEFAQLARLKNLKRLDVSGTQITCLDCIPESVKDLFTNDCTKLSKTEITKF